MLNISSRVAVAAALVCCTVGTASAHRATLDAELSTLYSGPGEGSTIYMLVCGRLQQTNGCYGSPGLGGFESACGLIEGVPSQQRDVITRAIYVLDRRTTKGDPLQLFVYRRTDKITPTSDTVSVIPTNQISLPIKGSPTAKCSLAANDGFLYAASDKDKAAVSIAKDTLAVKKVGGFTPPEHVRAITADARGYVTIAFDDGNLEFDPSGTEVGVGGGSYVMANTHNSVRPNP